MKYSKGQIWVHTFTLVAIVGKIGLVFNIMFSLNMSQELAFLSISIFTKRTTKLRFLSTFIYDMSFQVLPVTVLVPTLRTWICLLLYLNTTIATVIRLVDAVGQQFWWEEVHGLWQTVHCKNVCNKIHPWLVIKYKFKYNQKHIN